MNFAQKYASERRWLDKILIMELYHLAQVICVSSWTIRETAEYFQVSKATVSENLLLGNAFRANAGIESCGSRNKALIKLKELRYGGA